MRALESPAPLPLRSTTSPSLLTMNFAAKFQETSPEFVGAQGIETLEDLHLDPCFGIAPYLRVGLAQIEMGIGILRVQSQGTSIGLDRFVVQILDRVCVAEIGVGIPRIGVDAQSLLQRKGGLGVLAELVVRDTQTDPGLGVGLIDLHLTR